MPRPAIAIIGMACRFPKANGLEAFWRLLAEGRSGVTEGVPGSGEGRVGQLFPDADVRHACRFGAYLGDLDRFDAGFFRISPAEAELLDPQQRLMLETSWRALEDAGIPASRLRGSRERYLGSGPEPALGHRHLVQHRDRSGLLRARARGTRDRAGHGVLLLARRDPPGGLGAPEERGGPRARRGSAHDPLGSSSRAPRERRDAVSRWSVRDLRRRSERLRAR